MSTTGPTVVRRQLGRRLRQLRDAAGMSVEEVTSMRYLGISRAKLFRLEAGKHSVKPQDITVLCGRYGITSVEEIETLQALALATQEQSWWHIYGKGTVPEWFSLYVDLEPTASMHRQYEVELIPGLLQTRDYAWAVYRTARPDADFEEIERLVAVRMDRQQNFNRAHFNQLHAVINEGALLRAVGGDRVMAAQLESLHEAAERPGITIDVLPLRAGAHAAMNGAFIRLDFPHPEEDPSMAYVETASSAAYLEKPTEIGRYDTIFTRISASTIPLQKYSP